jgi:hypothetical protein
VSITRSGTIGITTGTLSNTVTVSLPAGLGDPDPGNNTATDTDTLVLFSSPYPPAPAAASANMVLRRTDGLYAIYNLGNNATLATHPLAQVGSEWQFAGLGGFQAGDTADMLLRNAGTGGFQVYDISNNNIANTAFLGNVGLDWQVMGFGNFSSRGETDMILRNATTGGVEVYDIANNKITGANFMGTVGLDWQFSGVGNFSGRGGSDLLLRNSNTGGLEVYDIANNQITNAAFIGAVGLDWQFSGVGQAVRTGALRLAGYLADPQLAEAIETSWSLDSDKKAHLADYLWAAALCCGSDPKRFLGLICDAWAALPSEKNDRGVVASPRNSWQPIPCALRFAEARPYLPLAISYNARNPRIYGGRSPICSMASTIRMPSNSSCGNLPISAGDWKEPRASLLSP